MRYTSPRWECTSDARGGTSQDRSWAGRRVRLPLLALYLGYNRGARSRSQYRSGAAQPIISV